jgi:SET domain-containing protein
MVEVLESSIHGYGVFAKRNFAAGHRFVISYSVLDDDDTDTIWNNSFDGWYPNPEIPWAYLNHCEKPVAEMEQEDSQMILTLLRDVEQDEEITIDYGDNYDWSLA